MPRIVADKMDWVKLGFKLFAAHGISGIIVDKMANKLKCNRSSFYWHFSSKKGFMDEIVEYWKETDTNEIIALTQNGHTASERFRTLIKIVFKADPNIDFIFHLKRYAIGKKNIQRVIDGIDTQRMEYVAALLRDLGHDESEAPEKAEIFYKYLIGYHEMIRYKKQEKDYEEKVYTELRHFIRL